MKKLVCIVMLLCLLIPCASAETLDDFIAAYMKYASIYSAPEISSNTLMKSNGAYFWRFDSGTMIIVIRDAKMNLEGVAVTGNEDCVGDMLAATICATVAMDEDVDINKLFQYVMSMYIDYRDHEKDFSYSFLTPHNIAVSEQYGSNLYQFIIGHTGL